jgi:hypothetical protein
MLVAFESDKFRKAFHFLSSQRLIVGPPQGRSGGQRSRTHAADGIQKVRPNHFRNRAPKLGWLLAAPWHRPSAAVRAASASASLRFAAASDSLAVCASAFARWASLVARSASSFVRCRASSTSASFRAIAADAFVLSASVFAFSISFSAESTSLFGGPLAEVGSEAGSAGAGCTVGVDGGDGAGVAAAREAFVSAGAGCAVRRREDGSRVAPGGLPQPSSLAHLAPFLDDRFHEPDHGTGDLLVDSSFAVR